MLTILVCQEGKQQIPGLLPLTGAKEEVIMFIGDVCFILNCFSNHSGKLMHVVISLYTILHESQHYRTN